MNYLAPFLVLPALLFQCGAATSVSAPVPPSIQVRPPAHARPAKHIVLQRGETRTFPFGALEAGDVVTCRLGGQPLRLRVPNRAAGTGWAIGTGAATTSGGTGELQLKSDFNGSITASCGGKSS
ncbi:MAG TPA: hypothetical protein VFA37_06225 [Gaiellaceae bacterium]|nr:hypothetical protein [Gaiellaceae bacterium]